MDLLSESSRNASQNQSSARNHIMTFVITVWACGISAIIAVYTSDLPAEAWARIWFAIAASSAAIFVVLEINRTASRQIQVEYLVMAAMRDYIAENIDGDIYWFERNHRLELSEILSTETDLSYDEIRRGIRAAAVRLNARMLLRSP